MVSNVLAAAAVLRRHYRRLASMSLLGLLGAAGLVPLVLYMPREDVARYLLLLLVCVYAGRKIVQLVHARAARKQLATEEHFLRYGSSSRRMQKAVRNEDEMWQRSAVVSGLRAIDSHPVRDGLMAEERRRLIYRRYRQAFRTLRPSLAVFDALLIAVLVATMLLAPRIQVSLITMLFLAGFVALALTGAVEAARWFVHRQLAESLERWFDALSDWTLRVSLEQLHARSEAYAHRLLYVAQPWFADGGESSGADRTGVNVLAGDGGSLPSGIAGDEDG
jgi:hypothetical protein